MIACFYEFERDIIREQTKKSLESKRKRGIMGGRPRVASSKINKALEDYKKGDVPVQDILKIYGLGRSTFYHYLEMDKKKFL